MKYQFWYRKWRRDQIGFHQPEYNEYMVDYFSNVKAEEKTVFVPMMGKTKDVFYLLEKGFKVVGVEFVEKAIEDFLVENKLDCEREKVGDFLVYNIVGHNLTLYCGDCFHFADQIKMTFDYIYDRAALIALDKPMRELYAVEINKLSKSDTKQLVVSIEYNQEEMNGPPFSVQSSEIYKLYPNWQVKTLLENEADEESIPRTKWKLSQLTERSSELKKN